jgi:putative ABC transport system permease protein
VSSLRIIIRNLGRNKVRSLLTILAIMVATLAFIMIRTIVSAWEVAADHAVQDRLITRNKVSFVIWIPRHYVDTVRQIPGVKSATTFNWFGGKDPKTDSNSFASLAVDGKSYFDVFDEVRVTPEEKKRWLENRQGAILGDVLAKQMGVKVGDRVTLTGTIYAGDWTFIVDGIYTATRKSVDRSQFLFHLDYLNDQVPERRRDLITWITARIEDPARGAQISAAIDKVFDIKDIQTTTMSERAFTMQYLATVSAMIRTLDITSVVFLLIMALILGNSMAMGVRERTREYGVLQAIGYGGSTVLRFITAEAVCVSLIGAGLGIGLSIPLVELQMGRWLEENMGSWFPYFRINTATFVAALVCTALVGAIAGLIPARSALRTQISVALRQVA